MLPKIRYIDPTTVFGFKRIFGQFNKPDSVEVLKAFIYDILEPSSPIKNMWFLPADPAPDPILDNLFMLDVHCIGEDEKEYIVKLLQGSKADIKESLFYYTSFTVNSQVDFSFAKRNLYGCLPIYSIGISTFALEPISPSNQEHYFHWAQYMNTATKKVLFDDLAYIFVELEKFKKPLEELEIRRDKWFYLLKHMSTYDNVPDPLHSAPYDLAFQLAEIFALSESEKQTYQQSLQRTREARNLHNVGNQMGQLEEKQEIAHKMVAKGFPTADIADITGLPVEHITKLQEPPAS